MIGEKLIKLQRQFDVLKSKHPEAAPELYALETAIEELEEAINASMDK